MTQPHATARAALIRSRAAVVEAAQRFIAGGQYIGLADAVRAMLAAEDELARTVRK